MQPQNEQAVMIIAGDRRVLNRTRKLNHLFKPAVSNLELVMRNSFATYAVASQATDAQQAAVDRDLDILGPDARQINLHDPAIPRAVHIGGRTPQTSRGALFTRVMKRPT